MRPTAAGRAGGRATPARGLLTAAVATGLLTTGAIGTAPAAAAPPVTAAPGAPDLDRPVEIAIGQFPRSVTEGSTVRVTGRLTNAGELAGPRGRRPAAAR